MAFPAIVNSRVPVRSSLLLKLCIVPNISSSLFSSLCTRKVFLTHPTEAPPVPKKIPFTVTAHGRSWEDPYHWMSKIDDPDLSDYLNRENSYAEAFMADTQDLQHQLFTEMNHRTPSVISTPPECWGPWLYYQHIPEGKEYPVICRRLNPKKNSWAKCFLNYVRNRFRREEILLDWNGIAEQFGKTLSFYSLTEILSCFIWERFLGFCSFPYQLIECSNWLWNGPCHHAMLTEDKLSKLLCQCSHVTSSSMCMKWWIKCF